jgi:Flp pilus assembly protein TadG
MSGSFFRRRGAKLRHFMRSLRRDVAGVAAVEFAYLVPVLLLMLIGTVEVSRAVSMDRRFGLATSMVADLVAREKTMSADDLNAIYNIIDHIMSPYDASTLKVSVIPVKASPTDVTNTRVYPATTNRPSHNGGSQPAKCSKYTLNTGLVGKGASVIVVETSYQYVPLFLNYVLGSSTWTDKAILSPRNSCVDFDGDNCVSTCF